MAENSIYVPLFTYRTGPFAGSGTPYADGMHDYLTMLNERDGGIGGVKLMVDECETGYDTKKGLEVLQLGKTEEPGDRQSHVDRHHALADTQSRGRHDSNPILRLWPLGLRKRRRLPVGSSTRPPRIWTAFEILKYVGGGSIEALKGKTLGYLYFDGGFGREPIPLFQSLAKDIGFDLKLYSVAPTDMQNQSSKWLDIRRDKPDFLVMYGWGAMNPTAIKEAVKAKFPMDKFISIWWTNDNDVAAAGEGGKGFLEVMLHGSGADYPAFAQIKKLVIDAGKSQTPAGEFGQVIYDRGVYNAVLTAEAIANAQKISGRKVVTGEEVRRGLESINLDPGRLKTLGLEGFASPFKLTCADHNSHGANFVQQWDGAKWVKITGLISPASDKVQPLLDEAAKAYAQKNAGWPARTEACDNKS